MGIRASRRLDGLNQADLRDQVRGLVLRVLTCLLAGRAAVTAEMALRLGRFCGSGPDLWLRMQQAHDLWHARARLGAELETIPAHSVR